MMTIQEALTMQPVRVDREPQRSLPRRRQLQRQHHQRQRHHQCQCQRQQRQCQCQCQLWALLYGDQGSLLAASGRQRVPLR